MRIYHFNRGVLLLLLALFAFSEATAKAQTTTFTYQGKLTIAGTPANGNSDMQFKLFDTSGLGTGTQQGVTVTNPTVQATNGIFNVSIDFGVVVFDGSPRFLEISVRPAGSPDPYTVLAPRQPITSTPYAIKSLSAVDASQLGGVAASEYIVTTDTRLTDERPPLAGSPNYLQNTMKTQPDANFNISGNGVIGGDLTVLGTLNANFVGNFINNSMKQQPDANFNISGNGVAGGALAASLFDSATQYNIGGNAVLSLGAGVDNLFVGPFAGQTNPTGGANSFFGVSAGFNTTTGSANAFFGRSAGFQNTSGADNSFFGVQAGRDNSTGINNSFFGRAAGIANTTANDNSYFGAFTGQFNTTGSANSFFGASAGFNNSTGTGNSFFGRSAGFQNTTGDSNAFFGVQAGRDNSTGDENSFFGRSAGMVNSTGSANSFFGFAAGREVTSGSSNVFVGWQAGAFTTTGSSNTFVGYDAGTSSNGSANSFFGDSAGSGLSSGSRNSLFGASAGGEINNTSDNAFFGALAGFASTSSPTIGSKNTFYGSSSGHTLASGEGNVALGFEAGYQINSGSNNTYVGREAGKLPVAFPGSNGGNGNTLIGYNATRVASVNNSTAIGVNSSVSTSNTIVLGTAAETVRIPGSLVVSGAVSKGGGSFKIDHPLDPENKYLYHSFVESPDMMNIYNGNITTDENGEAVVEMPDYFDALNKDCRYQLTVIGQFAQAIVASKMKGNRFVIKTNAPNVEVSWMVTGVRHDAYADRNRVKVEEVKPEKDRGFYLHPEAFNQPEEKSIEWARNPEMMQLLKQQRLQAEEKLKKQQQNWDR